MYNTIMGYLFGAILVAWVALCAIGGGALCIYCLAYGAINDTVTFVIFVPLFSFTFYMIYRHGIEGVDSFLALFKRKAKK